MHRITIARKLRFLAEQARLEQQAFLESLKVRDCKISQVQFDDVETFEHTKLKPLSIALAVNMQRKVLGFEVSSMPAKGHLAVKSVEKYGRRRDERKKGLQRLLKSLEGVVNPQTLFQSDQNPHYPPVLRNIFPHAIHQTTKGRRGCISGQGELKKVVWDPLFSLNHTAAMLRANINRLIRRTWCTTKKPQRLSDHLAIYINFHNQVLTD